MEVKPKNLTIVILTIDRHKFLKRTISYYLNFNYNILIVDGTKKKLKSELLKNNKVLYIHSVSHYYERYFIASRNIKSKYTIVVNDDEFFLESGLNLCLNFLEKNKDYATACGHVIAFFSRYNKLYGYQGYRYWDQRLVLSNNIFDRIKTFTMNIMSTQPYNSVMRTKTFKKVGNFLNIYEDKTSISFIELLINLTIISAGKTKLFKHLMWFRSLENEPISTKDWNRKAIVHNFYYWYFTQKKSYKKKLIQNYVKISFDKAIQKKVFNIIFNTLEETSIWWSNKNHPEKKNKIIDNKSESIIKEPVNNAYSSHGVSAEEIALQKLNIGKIFLEKLLVILSKYQINNNFLIKKILNLISKTGLLQFVYGTSLEKSINKLIRNNIKINTKDIFLVNSYLKKHYNLDV